MACCKGEAAMVSFCARVILVSLSKLDHLELTSTARVLRREKAYGTAGVRATKGAAHAARLREARRKWQLLNSPSRARAQGWASRQAEVWDGSHATTTVGGGAVASATISAAARISHTAACGTTNACSADISADTAARS